MAKIKLKELKYVGPVSEDLKETVEEVQAETEPAEPEHVEPATAEEPFSDDEPVAEVQTTEVTEPEKVQEDIGVVTKPVAAKSEKEIKMVNNIRVRTKPSDNIPAKSYSGNVEITGHIGEFTIVRYVKPGFGSVIGYTKDC